jgi:diguanylate cyclase (GGDEF)-like protein
MILGLFGWRPSSQASLLGALLVTCALALSPLISAHAEHSNFRTYDADQGLASVGGSCMLQDRAGYMLVCTEHGVFTYDGRRFSNLGKDQGLRQGGFVDGLALTSTGRIAVEFADEVLISDRAPDAFHPPSSLSFRSVLHPGVAFYDERPHRLAPWQNGLVLLTGDTALRIIVPEAGPSHADTMDYDLEERKLLADASAVFSVRGHLWETFSDGRLCAADPGAVKCYAGMGGRRGGPWMDVVAGPDGSISARSASSVGTLDPSSSQWSIVYLPDQGDRYTSYTSRLGLFRIPDGRLLTQADHGLAILSPEGWRMLTVEDGAPSGTIVSAVTDATGQLWFQILGRGLVRWVGFGRWETLEKADGLSDGLSWQSARPPGGAMWVSTDTGVDEVVRHGPFLRIGRVFNGPSFALTVGLHGELWSSSGLNGVRIIDPAVGSVTKLDVPPVNTIVPDSGGFIWIGTEAGLFRVVDRPGVLPRAVLEGSPRTRVPAIVDDGFGGIYYISGGRLRHRHDDGTDISVSGTWPTDGFEPLALAIDHDGRLWIVGAGGLFYFILSHDHVSSYQSIPTSDTRTNTIVALMVDHRGWVWVGTALGISVFDRQRWVSVDADGGLLSDDVDQGGIREDPDGSVWIATTAGFSHLLDPKGLFTDRPLEVVVSQALLGSQPVVGHRMPYTKEALSIQLGTPNYGAERSVSFRYRLTGVDARWVESTSGTVRYPFVPPGRHVLTVVGSDELTHRSSRPTTLVVEIAFPWWRRWWSETIWGVTAAGVVYCIMRLHHYIILARQEELKRHVATATEEIHSAQASLRYQAAHDTLTGLLNRSEIERRLAAKLSSDHVADEMVVALIDVDHFKRVNDNYGHLGGDDVLRALGHLVCRSVRDSEYAGRYGGEEILLVLDDTDGLGAERVLNLHLAIRYDTFKVAGAAVHVTCSIGVAWAVPGDGWESLIGRADDALYEAKEGGRDRVVESRHVSQNVSSIAAKRPGPADA